MQTLYPITCFIHVTATMYLPKSNEANLNVSLATDAFRACYVEFPEGLSVRALSEARRSPKLGERFMQEIQLTNKVKCLFPTAQKVVERLELIKGSAYQLAGVLKPIILKHQLEMDLMVTVTLELPRELMPCIVDHPVTAEGLQMIVLNVSSLSKTVQAELAYLRGLGISIEPIKQ